MPSLANLLDEVKVITNRGARLDTEFRPAVAGAIAQLEKTWNLPYMWRTLDVTNGKFQAVVKEISAVFDDENRELYRQTKKSRSYARYIETFSPAGENIITLSNTNLLFSVEYWDFSNFSSTTLPDNHWIFNHAYKLLYWMIFRDLGPVEQADWAVRSRIQLEAERASFRAFISNRSIAGTDIASRRTQNANN